MEYKKPDKKTFFKGLRGELTLEEIEKLPKEYDYYKESFKNIFEHNKTKEMFENTDEELVAKGFSGELTHEEIDNLPKEYDKFKERFHEWTTFMSHDNGNSKIKTTLREFEVAKRIVDLSNKKGISYLKEIFKLRNGFKRSKTMKPIYNKSDVTPDKEIKDRLINTTPLPEGPIDEIDGAELKRIYAINERMAENERRSHTRIISQNNK